MQLKHTVSSLSVAFLGLVIYFTLAAELFLVIRPNLPESRLACFLMLLPGLAMTTVFPYFLFIYLARTTDRLLGGLSGKGGRAGDAGPANPTD